MTPNKGLNVMQVWGETCN